MSKLAVSMRGAGFAKYAKLLIRFLVHSNLFRAALRFKVAVGIAVPAVEAWYRCGLDPHVTEAAWIASLPSGPFPYTTRSLKEDVYGTSRLSLELETRCATKEARRLAQNLQLLEQCFPTGFGALTRDVRSW